MENLVIELLPADYEAIAELWEASVRATHHFLKPEEIGFYKPYLLKYALPACRLYGIKTNEGKLCAFIGLSDDKIEMLFVNPKFFKNGCGRRRFPFRSVELVDLPGQAVELDGQLAALVAGDVAHEGQGAVLELEIGRAHV